MLRAGAVVGILVVLFALPGFLGKSAAFVSAKDIGKKAPLRVFTQRSLRFGDIQNPGACVAPATLEASLYG